jgi:serine beta-lactamase-like protein LACTB
MKRHLIVLIPILLSCFYGYPQDDKFYIAKSKTDSLISILLKDYPGISLAISLDNDIVYSEAYGYSDIKVKKSLNVKSKFNMYSVSKVMTGAAIVILWGKEKIDLDTPIVQYLPELKYKPTERVTIRQLLGHTSGIIEPEEEEINNWKFGRTPNSTSPRQTLKTFIDIPLEFEPGFQMSYTTYGYVLLSAIIESVTGNYEKFMEKAIFKPSGMADTFIDGRKDSFKNRSKQYVIDRGGKLIESEFPDASCKWGGGGFVTTSEDMVKFSIALMHNKLTTQTGLDMMLIPIETTDGKHKSYGFGIVTYFSSSRKTRQANHGGGNLDGRTYLTFFPDKKVSVAIALNAGSDKGEELARTIFEISDTWLNLD